MRQMISGLVAAVAVMTAGAAPASACGWGIGCCGGAWASPCATYVPTTAYIPTVTYVPTTNWGYWGCGSCGYTNYGAGSERGTVYPYRWRHHYHYRPSRHYSDRQG